ncbi:MAG TPA: NAD(P)/FAD-dependent oxidoreductase [Candidatus Limnocylindria bacterium]|nr:NAD(P)/FAD-dependent oxidoreductase [Candidatus Limnocylindria bacterium]
MKACDVAVVGAGPAGCSAAITLAQRGLQVALIDRAVFPRDKVCGDFLNPINWPVLQELNVAEDLFSVPHTRVSKFRLTVADGSEAVSVFPEQSERQFGLGLRRIHLDHLLVEQAKRAGVDVYEGARLTAVRHQSSGWCLDLNRGGELDSLRPKLLVGADGRNSWVARQLGVASGSPVRSATVGFALQLQNVPGVGGSVEIHQFAGGYAGLVRVDEDTVNLGFAVSRSLLGRSICFETLRANHLRRNQSLDELLSAAEPKSDLRSAWPVYFPPRRCFGDGFLLVGDAARVTEPITGEGVYLALRSGQLAAATIATAIEEGNLSSVRLAAYDRACREEFGARLRLNSLIRYFVYRPRLLSPAIALLSRRQRLLDSLVSAVCLRRAVDHG